MTNYPSTTSRNAMIARCALALVFGSSLLGCDREVDEPSEVIVGHFYFTGANRHDISIADAGGTRELSVWMGGGFYSGWPVRIVERPAGPDGPALEYRRIL